MGEPSTDEPLDLRWNAEEGVLVVHELPVMTIRSIDRTFVEADRLTAGVARYSVVVDLSATARPNAEIRGHLRTKCAERNHRIVHLALVTGSFLVSVAMSVAAKFIHQDLTSSFGIYTSVDDALRAIRQRAPRAAA